MSETTTIVSAGRSRALVWGASLSVAAISAALAGVKLLLHLAAIRHYGFFRDELYYMACGEHLAWGYIDQPPLIALIAWLERHLFGNSIVAMRLLPVLAGAAVVLLTGLLARELSGGRFAQSLASATILFAPAYLAFDSFLSMNAFEPVFWLACAWIAVRALKGASPKIWLAFGAVAGLGVENKHTMLLFCFALVAGLLLSGEHRVLRSKWIWLAALIAFALLLPNLIWEARHGWPQIEVVRNAQRFKNVPISPLRFLDEQILFLGPLALPVWLAGLLWCFGRGEGKRFRFLGWMYLIVLAAFILLRGKSYYPLPVYPLLVAAGGVAIENFAASRGRRWIEFVLPALIVLGGLASLPFGVPVLPVGTLLRYASALPYSQGVRTERDATGPLSQLYADMFGWDNMAETVARVYHALPPSEQADCAILAGNYGEAGAIDYYGPSLGLPKAISGHNSYFDWGPRSYSGGCVILFGKEAARSKDLWQDVQRVATISNEYAMPVEQDVPVYLCRKPRAPLSVVWPHFKMII